MTSWHVEGTRVPDGAEVEWWIRDGILTTDPVEDAREAPGDHVVEGGLVDAHVHLTFEPHTRYDLPRGSPSLVRVGLRDQRAAGVLAVRDAGSLPGVALRSGEGVAVTGCGPVLAPAGGFHRRLHEPVAPADAAEVAAAQIRAGWPWAKVILDYPGPDGNPLNARVGYEPAVLREIVDAVHGAGGSVAMHVMARHVHLAIESGADSIEHGNTADADAVREMAARGISWTPTLITVAERYLEPNASAPPVRALLDHQRETLPLAAELGVRVLAGTDEEPHGSVAREVAALVRYGLPPDIAVAAATSAGHALLGTPPVRAGEPARLVTFEGDPLADPSVLAHPAAVFTAPRGRP